MAVALYAVLAYVAWTLGPVVARAWETPALDPAMLKAVWLTFAELAVVTAIALFFSTFSTPLLSAALTFALVVAGRFSVDLRNFDQAVDAPAAVALARFLYWVLPNLAPFDVRSQVVHGLPVSMSYLAVTSLYGVLYVCALLAVAVFIFSRRDFK
jgi:hypothetical protein